MWKELVKTSFRRCYQFPTTASHSWFPGHMHKGLGQIQRRMGNVDCVLEVHDARIPLSGRNYTFRETVNGARPHILVLNKQDLFPEEEKEAIKKKILANSPNISKVLFTNCRNRDCEGTAAILPTLSCRTVWVRSVLTSAVTTSITTTCGLWLSLGVTTTA